MQHDDVEWVDVGTIEEWKPNSGRLIKIGARRLGVYRFEDKFYAVKDYCPHAGVSLVAGSVAENSLREPVVTCMAHGWRFRLNDGCMVGGHGDCRVAAYPCRTVLDKVQVGI